MKAGWIGIALGDFSGIGPEVALKALDRILEEDGFRYLLIGDSFHINRLKEELQFSWPIQDFGNYGQDGCVFICDPREAPLPETLEAGSPLVANASMDYLTEGARCCLDGELAALVTAPVNKQAITNAERDFVGQTEFLSQLAGTEKTAMMLLGHDDRERWLRVVLATTHLPLCRVASLLTKEKVLLAIRMAAKACGQLGLSRRRIGVCGLNPHAGEGGRLGGEEIEIIAPAVEQARAEGVDAIGPVAADTLFHQAFKGDFEVVVAMYHDQGLGPLKMVAFDTGVNWTVGLPFIRTSPDHGTAYELAGKSLANPSSMVAAIRLAKRLVTDKAG